MSRTRSASDAIDPRSGAYKVARFFHSDTLDICNLGMEVFTIGEDSCWRETDEEPPYPCLARRTATFCKGSLIWTVDVASLIMYHDEMNAADLPSFVRFSLEDESFSVMATPQ
jgi:hypothetical protein